MVWDEENRLRGINDNGRLHLYTYDHTGERALKSSAESSMAVINGATSAIITHTEDYTAYVSPYFVVQKGKFTKHYFEGSSRIVSKLGEGTFSHKNTGIMAGGIDYIAQSAQVQTAIDQYIRGLQVPPGPPTQHGIYASPEWTGEAYPSIDWSEVSQNQEPPEGWPRPPKFNDPGDVPGPPVQFGEAITNTNVKAGYGFIPNGVEEKNLYFYHPDHLGSSSYITNKDGEIIQHTEYIAFGETFVDEHSVSNKQPYLFNGKELDYETGLYYYGARYYDAKTSLWLNTDPLSGYNPVQEDEHYIDGEHNEGIYNVKNSNTYTYTYQNPIMLIDPNGKQTLPQLLENALNWAHDTSIGRKIYRAGNNISDESSKEIISYTPLRNFILIGELAESVNNNSDNISDIVVSSAINKVTGKIGISSRQARREVMRKEGIPTSQQPKSQSKNSSGREYSYDVSKKGGGTQTKSVQQQTKDRSHQGQPHWEAGKVKTDDHGNIQMNRYNRPKLANPKSKVNY